MVPLSPNLTLTFLIMLLVTPLYGFSTCKVHPDTAQYPKGWLASTRGYPPSSTLGMVAPSIWGGGPRRWRQRAVPGAEQDELLERQNQAAQLRKSAGVNVGFHMKAPGTSLVWPAGPQHSVESFSGHLKPCVSEGRNFVS